MYYDVIIFSKLVYLVLIFIIHLFPDNGKHFFVQYQEKLKLLEIWYIL